MSMANLGVGLILSFSYCWPITLLILAFLPLIVVGGAFQTKMMTGFSGKDKQVIQDAGKVNLKFKKSYFASYILRKLDFK